MPLLDHFEEDMRDIRRDWGPFHTMWLAEIAARLNRDLPPNFFSQAETRAGAKIIIDVGTYQQGGPVSPVPSGNGSTATATAVYAPPEVTATVPVEFAQDFEAKVFWTGEGAPELVAAIELVSPRNKDRPESRSAFATKCASYLHQGVALSVVDVVTRRHFNLHGDILALVGTEIESQDHLYAASYRPVRRDERDEVDYWQFALGLGAELPEVPLSLLSERFIPLNLEETYAETCRRSRIT